MDLMVNPVITKFAQKVDGEITELKLGENQEDAYAQIYQKGAESGGGKVENNKAATIDVSTYSAPVEVTPTSGKTSMKKATVTLSNIPSGSGTLKFPAYKIEGVEEDTVIWANMERTLILNWWSPTSSMMEGYSIEYDETNDEITVTGDMAGTYERDTSNDLYVNS